MIDYLADMVGVDPILLSSDLGIILILCIVCVLAFGTLRGIIIWLQKLFGGN